MSRCRYWRLQSLHGPEEEGLGELPVAFRHAAGDVHQQKHHGLNRRLLALAELSKAQVVIRERRRIFVLHRAPLDRFAHAAPAIEPRTRTALVPAFARPVRFLGLADARFQIRQLHLFPQPVDDVIDLEFEHELDAALVLAAGALVRAFALLTGLRQHIAGFDVALPDTLAVIGFSQAEVIVLEHAHRHLDRARTATHDVGAGNDVGEPLANGFADLVVVAQPVACAAGEQLVPTVDPGIDWLDLRLVHCHLPVRRARYSCARRVVT